MICSVMIEKGWMTVSYSSFYYWCCCFATQVCLAVVRICTIHVNLHVAKRKEERVLTLSSVFKEKRNCPNGCDADQCINDACQEIQIAVENGAHQVELEQTDESPVETADDNQNQD